MSWFFRNRETGMITVAQAPNIVLWIVIGAAMIRWIWPLGVVGMALNVVVTGGLLIWAADEIIRGVNRWRRCLGTVVFGYELTTML